MNAAADSEAAGQSFDRPVARGLDTGLRPNLLQEPWAQHLLADSDPEAVRSFEEGIRLLGSNSCVEARSLFERMIQSYPKDKIDALASWAIGLTYLSEGGIHNLHQAANQFIRFRDAYGSDKDLEELVRAAMIDIPVISIDLMNYAPSEYERTHAADLALKTLRAFLERWPDDAQAPAARAALADVESFLLTEKH